MNTEKVIEQIQSNILTEVIRTGNKYIDADALLQYLDQVKNSADVQIEVQQDLAKQEHEAQIEALKLNTSIRLKNYETLSSQALEMFKAVIAMGQSAIRNAILINGAAAVAMMSFIGNAASKSGNCGLEKIVSVALAMFAYGALTGAISSGATYLTQLIFSYCYAKDMKINVDNFGKEHPEKIDQFTKAKILAYAFQGIAILSGIISYWFFYRGISEYIGK
jgi:hypothetical protein